jgi:hypothetical protein
MLNGGREIMTDDNFMVLCSVCECSEFRFVVDLPFTEIKRIVEAKRPAELLQHLVTVCVTCGERNKGAHSKFKVKQLKAQHDGTIKPSPTAKRIQWLKRVKSYNVGGE